MGQENLGEVRNGSRDPRGGLGRVGGPLETSGTVQGTLGMVRDDLGDRPWDLGRIR